MKKICAFLWLLLIGGCAGSYEQVLIDGSSTVFPITEAMAVEFQFENRDIRVTIGVSGTGGGIKKFIRKEIDIVNASRPLSPMEVEQMQEQNIEFIELPVAFDGLAVVVHPENNWVDHLTVEELRMLWHPDAQGKITRWNQIRPSWPDKEIHLFGAGTASGTFDYFTEAIVGQAKSSRGDYTASEDDNVLVQGIATDPLALGYFGLEYYQENQEMLKLVPIDDENAENGDGPILPTEETVKNGTYQPLSRPLLIYVNRHAVDVNPAVGKFVAYYLKNAEAIIPETGYIPLNTVVYDLAMQRFDNRKTGSVFSKGKSNVGIKMEEVLK